MQKRIPYLMLSFLMAVSATLSAAPVGYSINSDSGEDNSDGLWRIDLATGLEIERIGTVQSLLQTRLDVEGLAFAPNGTLYGIDDESLKLFPIDVTNAVIDSDQEVDIANLSSEKNDVGMTFACDDRLYVSSVTKQSLYHMSLDGVATVIGAEGGLGARISALAAFGSPVELYGLENGSEGDGASTLYRIDVSTGVATKVGQLDAKAGTYAEAGLAFDDAGQLWAITDRRPLLLPSQVMKIDKASGTASEIKDTSEEGYESLAITVPGGCAPPVNIDDDSTNQVPTPIPTLNPYALLLFSVLMLITGAVATRKH